MHLLQPAIETILIVKVKHSMMACLLAYRQQQNHLQLPSKSAQLFCTVLNEYKFYSWRDKIFRISICSWSTQNVRKCRKTITIQNKTLQLC